MGLHKMGALTPHFHCEEEILTEKVYTLRRWKQRMKLTFITPA